MKLFSLLFLSLCLARPVLAQDTLSLRRYETGSRLILKASPLTLINFDPALQAGAEWRTGTRQSVQLVLGYGQFNYYVYDNDQYTHQENWRVRGEYRWYYRHYRSYLHPGRRGGSFPLGSYFSVEGFFKQINARNNRTIGRECESGPCAYFERMDLPVSRFITAGYAKVGWQFPLQTQPLSRFLLDCSLGLGLRHASVREYGVSRRDQDAWFGNGGFFYNRVRQPEQPVLPDFTLDIKLGYRLGK